MASLGTVLDVGGNDAVGFVVGRKGARPLRRDADVATADAKAGAVLLPFPELEMGRALVRQLGDLNRYARRLARQGALAQDLVQETCRRALETRARFAHGTNLRSWLFCILRNLYCDHVRRGAREAICRDEDVEALPHRHADVPVWRNVSDEDLAVALASLPATHRQAYVMHSIEGKSYAEIARELEIPLGTVGTRLLRARRRLCRLLLVGMREPSIFC